jgi:hypothetical protein
MTREFAYMDGTTKCIAFTLSDNCSCLTSFAIYSYGIFSTTCLWTPTVLRHCNLKIWLEVGGQIEVVGHLKIPKVNALSHGNHQKKAIANNMDFPKSTSTHTQILYHHNLVLLPLMFAFIRYGKWFVSIIDPVIWPRSGFYINNALCSGYGVLDRRNIRQKEQKWASWFASDLIDRLLPFVYINYCSLYTSI